jgi:phage terminase small subunit
MHSGMEDREWKVMSILSNPRHERVAQELSTGKSATEAYKNRTAASRLSTKVNIQARVKELQTEAAQKTKITIESLIREAEEVRGLAVTAGQLSAANTAIVTKAKLSGLWIDRSEVGMAVDFSRMSKEELNEYIRHRYGEHADELIAWLEKQAKASALFDQNASYPAAAK